MSAVVDAIDQVSPQFLPCRIVLVDRFIPDAIDVSPLRYVKTGLSWASIRYDDSVIEEVVIISCKAHAVLCSAVGIDVGVAVLHGNDTP